MTNREKFKEVYGFELDGSPCAAPQSICNEQTCERCPFWGWWDKEYKACFRYEEEKEEKTMTRTEIELVIINKLFEIRALAKEYDENITDITMSVSEYAEDDESEVLRGMKIVRFYTNKDLDARWSSSDGEIYEPDTMDVLAEGVSV